MRRLVLPSLPLLILDCKTWTLPTEVPAAERFEPPAIYRVWHDEARGCTGLDGRFEDIKWFVVEKFDPDPGCECWDYGGLWRYPHEIYLKRIYVEDRWFVEHEIIHDLLQEGHTDQNERYFKECNPAYRRPGGVRVMSEQPSSRPLRRLQRWAGTLWQMAWSGLEAYALQGIARRG